MSQIAEAIGFNLIVISPTVALVVTVLILLFFTITVETSLTVKKWITFLGILVTVFCVFLKFFCTKKLCHRVSKSTELQPLPTIILQKINLA